MQTVEGDWREGCKSGRCPILDCLHRRTGRARPGLGAGKEENEKKMLTVTKCFVDEYINTRSACGLRKLGCGSVDITLP